MSKQNDLLSELSADLDFDTDDGNFNMGDLLVIVLDLVLLVYTGFRSYDLLSGTVPAGHEILALVGLWGLDIGAIIWSLVWIFGSSTKFQDWTSMTFFIIDLLGVMMTSLTDSLMYGSESELYATIVPITTVLIPLVVLGNVIAGFIYHMTSPATRQKRQERRNQERQRKQNEHIQQRNTDLQFAQAAIVQKQRQLKQLQALAKIKIFLNTQERTYSAALTGGSEIGEALTMAGIDSTNNITALPSVDDAQLSTLMNELQGLQPAKKAQRTPPPRSMPSIDVPESLKKISLPDWEWLNGLLGKKESELVPVGEEYKADGAIGKGTGNGKGTPEQIDALKNQLGDEKKGGGGTSSPFPTV